MIFGLEQEGGGLITPMALAHPLHPIDNRSRNKRRNLWVGRCVSSWWPWFPSGNSVLIYMYIYICVYIPYTSSVIGRIYNGSVIQCWREQQGGWSYQLNLALRSSQHHSPGTPHWPHQPPPPRLPAPTPAAPPPPRPVPPPRLPAPAPTAPHTTPPSTPSAAPSARPPRHPHHPAQYPRHGSQHPPPRHHTPHPPPCPAQPPEVVEEFPRLKFFRGAEQKWNKGPPPRQAPGGGPPPSSPGVVAVYSTRTTY